MLQDMLTFKTILFLVSLAGWIFRVFKVFGERLEMKKKYRKLVLRHSLAINKQELPLFVLFSHAAVIVFKTAERFLLVCSSMTAGCSRTPEVK